jgi:hypothetical protein
LAAMTGKQGQLHFIDSDLQSPVWCLLALVFVTTICSE